MFCLKFTGHLNQYIRIISVAVHFKLLIDQSMEVKSSWSLLCCDHHHITASSCYTYMFHFGRSFFHSGLHLLLWGHGEYWFAKCREFWLNGRLSHRILKETCAQGIPETLCRGELNRCGGGGRGGGANASGPSHPWLWVAESIPVLDDTHACLG